MRMVLATVLATALPVVASAQGIRDTSSHTPGTITIPAKGGTYVDPVFGTTILRVTDVSDRTSTTWCRHAYAYWPALNHDENRLLVSCGLTGYIYSVDLSTNAVSRERAFIQTGAPGVQFEGATWSYSSPYIIFAISNTGIYKLDVSPPTPPNPPVTTYTLLKDFTSVLPANTHMAQLTTDSDAQTFSFSIRNNAAPQAVVAQWVWDRATNTTYKSTDATPTITTTINEGMVDKVGGSVLLEVAGTYILWDFRASPAPGGTDMVFNSATDDIGGHHDVGATTIVTGAGGSPGPVVRTIATPHTWNQVIRYRTSYPSGGDNVLTGHYSLQQVDETTFVGSTYQRPATSMYPAFDKEIFLAKVDGSQFARLAHHRSAAGIYETEPHANIDMKGRYIVFSSDMANPGIPDVYILKIPSIYWPGVTWPTP